MYTKMNTYLRSLIVYFEHVLHPAAGSSESNPDRKSRKKRRSSVLSASPESYNMRGVQKKQDPLRRNPAP
jgi:hypothetical protein